MKGKKRRGMNFTQKDLREFTCRGYVVRPSLLEESEAFGAVK